MTKKHPTSPKVRREDEPPDDAFVRGVKGIVDWGKKNRRTVTIAAAVVVVAGAVAVWVVVQQRNLEITAQSRLAQVTQSVASGNAQLAVRDLQSFLQTFGSTAAGDQARLTLADVLLGQEQGDSALRALGDMPQHLDRPFGLAAARLEGAALEILGRYDDAVDAYRRLARNARFPYQRREALADAARVEIQHGDPQQAVDLYQQLLAGFGDDDSGREYYEMWLAEAQARARTGQGAEGVPPVALDTATAAEPAADTTQG